MRLTRIGWLLAAIGLLAVMTGLSGPAAAVPGRTEICHKANPAAPFIKITVDNDSLDSHLAHGDFVALVGPCVAPTTTSTAAVTTTTAPTTTTTSSTSTSTSLPATTTTQRATTTTMASTTSTVVIGRFCDDVQAGEHARARSTDARCELNPDSGRNHWVVPPGTTSTTVQPSSEPALALTGSSAWEWAAAGAFLMALGLALIVIGRREPIS